MRWRVLRKIAITRQVRGLTIRASIRRHVPISEEVNQLVIFTHVSV